MEHATAGRTEVMEMPCAVARGIDTNTHKKAAASNPVLLILYRCRLRRSRAEGAWRFEGVVLDMNTTHNITRRWRRQEPLLML